MNVLFIWNSEGVDDRPAGGNQTSTQVATQLAGEVGEIDSENGLEGGDNYEGAANEGIDDEFFEDIKSVREMIVALNKNNYNIQNLKGKYAKAIKAAQEKTNSDEMNDIINQNAQIHKTIKQKISDIKDRVNEAEKNEPDEPETKMKKNFYISLSKEVADALQKQQSYEDEFKNTVKDKVVRQVRLIDRDIDDEKAQEYVENPALAQEMLERKIYGGQASVTLKNTVSDIQDKFRDIKKLESSVTQCMELFNELNALVFAQG